MPREHFWASMRLYKTFPFLQVKCGRATTCPSLTTSFLVLFWGGCFIRSSSSLSSFRLSRRYHGCSAYTMKANDRQSFAPVFSFSTSPSLLGGKWALPMQLGWVIFGFSFSWPSCERDNRGHLRIGLPAGRYRLAWHLFTYADVTDSHVNT